MNPAIISVLQGLISLAPAAQELWLTLEPIISSGREPTPAEWAMINRLRDEAHAAVQSA